MVAWHYSLDAPMHPPGDFFQDVLRAMARADGFNWLRLEAAYPVHAQLMSMVKNDQDGRGKAMVEALARIAILGPPAPVVACACHNGLDDQCESHRDR
jgi:hypothetical protein